MKLIKHRKIIFKYFARLKLKKKKKKTTEEILKFVLKILD